MLWYEILAISVFVWTFFFGINVIYKFSKKKKLPEKQKKEFIRLFKSIKSPSNSDKQKIIDYDKLYHKILLALSYEGGFWEILKKEPNEIWDLDKVWALHKLRNKLVHDFDIISTWQLRKKASEYEKELKHILS